ncbi:hypothetical protein P43SY_004991 [Pythium insidiosum]|uniref:Uncharacterized protein n=1 Tax=Pythium insidiosum TaxID=114742 RepID=A0AAD5LND7_PYTIN|nr:hypothetical protein P43SY_004991 [Pythium insidiosum]
MATAKHDIVERVSYISSVHKDNDKYEGVKTPHVHDIEGGALREGGAPNLFSREHFGIILQYAAVGLIYGTLPFTVYPFLQKYLNVQGNQTITAATLIDIPWSFKAEYMKQVRLAQLEAECELEENLHIRARRLAREQAERERMRREQERMKPTQQVKPTDDEPAPPKAIEGIIQAAAEAIETVTSSLTGGDTTQGNASAVVATPQSTTASAVATESTESPASSTTDKPNNADVVPQSLPVYEEDAFEEEPEGKRNEGESFSPENQNQGHSEEREHDEEAVEARGIPQEDPVVSPVVDAFIPREAGIASVNESLEEEEFSIENEPPKQHQQGFLVDVAHDAVRIETHPAGSAQNGEHFQGFQIPVSEIGVEAIPSPEIASTEDEEIGVEDEVPSPQQPVALVEVDGDAVRTENLSVESSESKQPIEDVEAVPVSEIQAASLPESSANQIPTEPAPSHEESQPVREETHVGYDEDEVTEDRRGSGSAKDNTEPTAANVPRLGFLVDPVPLLTAQDNSPLHDTSQSSSDTSIGIERNQQVQFDTVQEHSSTEPDTEDPALVAQGWTARESESASSSAAEASGVVLPIASLEVSLHNVEMLAAQVEHQVDAVVERCDDILAESTDAIEKQIQSAIDESAIAIPPTIPETTGSGDEDLAMTELQAAMEAAARKIQAFWRQMEQKLGLREPAVAAADHEGPGKDSLAPDASGRAESPRDDATSPVETPRSSSPALEDDEAHADEAQDQDA